MREFGGMISVVLKGGLDSAKIFLERTEIFSLAESLGGVESLIEHPAIMTHASIPPEVREEIGISDGLVRLSVGIEALEDLIEDIEGALNKEFKPTFQLTGLDVSSIFSSTPRTRANIAILITTPLSACLNIAKFGLAYKSLSNSLASLLESLGRGCMITVLGSQLAV